MVTASEFVWRLKAFGHYIVCNSVLIEVVELQPEVSEESTANRDLVIRYLNKTFPDATLKVTRDKTNKTMC